MNFTAIERWGYWLGHEIAQWYRVTNEAWVRLPLGMKVALVFWTGVMVCIAAFAEHRKENQ